MSHFTENIFSDKIRHEDACIAAKLGILDTGIKEIHIWNKQCNNALISIMKTSPCNVYPCTPHFYIVKLGFREGYTFFLIFLLQKHQLYVLVRTASLRRF